MIENKLATTIDGATIESVVIGGDLSNLNPAQRVSYYRAVCESVGLNPLTRPFDYIKLNGKLTLYARKDATDQLREKHRISIGKPDITFQDEWIIVTVVASDSAGRTDSDVGVVNKKDMQGNFGNALMKAVTKAKRRVTLSICGLGMLDETEIETIPEAQPVVVEETGVIIDPVSPPKMSLETASAIVSSMGVLYGDIPTDKLAIMHNQILKSLKGPDLTDEKREEYLYKRDAIDVIMASRK